MLCDLGASLTGLRGPEKIERMRNMARKLRSKFEGHVCGKLKGPFTYESHRIDYSTAPTRHHYTPDVILSNGIIVEIKGRFLTADRHKHILIARQFPNLDIRFVFQNPKLSIYPGSKTTVADWADRNGFIWAVKEVPEEWENEPQKTDLTGLIEKEPDTAA